MIIPQSKSKLAVNIKGLSYRYSSNEKWALSNINLEIPQGSFFALVGPSGCGKSTLLTLLRGFQQEIGGDFLGKIEVLGQDVSKTSIAELGKVMGIVFQNPALQLHQLRVIDEVASSPMYQGLPYQDCIKKAKSLIDRFLGEDYYERSPNELSGGQQQKVALAASLALDAKVLLLDEPFSFLDELADDELIRLLCEFHENGTTVILATHDISQIAKIATQMGVLSEGKLILNDTPKKVLYSNEFSKILPQPLFIQAAKKIDLAKSPLSWKEILPEIKIKSTNKKPISFQKEKILSLENISFTYSEGKVGVQNVNFTIAEEQIFGIVGSNGSGKSTLAKVILGLLKPKLGRIIFGGTDITHLPIENRAKNIGYLTQDPSDMFFESTLLDEVSAGPKFLNQLDSVKKAEETLKLFRLWQYRDKHPDSISGGEKSRLGLADILANDTSILILDEPEFGLDPESWEEIISILKNLKNLGKTIIVIAQDLEAIFFLCDQVAVIKEGRILKVAPVIEIFKNTHLLEEAGLSNLPFFPLLKGLPSDITVSRRDFLELIEKKQL